MIPEFNLKSFLEGFHCNPEAAFVTNSAGFILEANQAASDLFKSDVDNLKNKGLITFGARKKACDSIREMISASMESDEVKMQGINMRPRNMPSFRASLTCKVIMKYNHIVLIYWTVCDADMQVSVGDAAE